MRIDTLGDTEYAIAAYCKAPNTADPGENYLLIYVFCRCSSCNRTQPRLSLAELLIYFTPTSAGRQRAPDADIFISFAQARVDALRALTAEVDAEYVRNPTDNC